MSMQEVKKDDTTKVHPPDSSGIEDEEEEIAAMVAAAKSKLDMDFGLGVQAHERITIDVLKQLARESPKRTAYAASLPLQASFRRLAVLILLLGVDTARLLIAEMGEHERAILLKYLAELPPAPLEEQIAVLKDFTKVALQANASLFGDPEFVVNITSPPASPAVDPQALDPSR